MEYTHKQLCELGAKFLKKSRNWNFSSKYVVKELVSQAGESPDVFAVRGYSSILIECKTSRSDFFADLKKPHRKEGCGVGLRRYYLCPKELIKEAELPKGWGLLYVGEDGNIEVVRNSECFEQRDFRDEFSIYYSIIRRTNKEQIFNFN